MKLGEIYELFIKKGLEKDPRTRAGLKRELARVKKEYSKLKPQDKKYFDKERLKQPYADTRILFGDKNKEIRTIMVGVDIDSSEILTAYLMNEKGACIDLVMAHHPSGRALANLHEVMRVQADVINKFGVNLDIAKKLMEKRIKEVSRSISSRNHEKAVDTAKLMGIPFMCAHTPADNHVADFLQKSFDRKKPTKVREVLGMLKAIPEYRDGMTKSSGPHLIAGKEDNKAGKVFVDMTGGTEGSKKIFARLSQAGVDTVVAMHFSEAHFKSASAEFMNVVIAGHIASDNLGLNLMIDSLTNKEDFNIIPCSGFVRVKR